MISQFLSSPSFRFFVIGNAVMVLNYAFHLASARVLTIEDYSILALFLSFFMLGNVFGQSVQTLVAREEALKSEKFIIRETFLVGVFVFAVCVIGSLWGSEVWAVSSWLFVWLGGTLLVSYLVAYQRGISQGRSLFDQLSFSFLGETLIKFFILLCGAYFLKNFNWSLGAWAVFWGMFCLLFMQKLPLSKLSSSAPPQVKRELLFSSIAFFLLMGFLSLDYIMLKLSLPEAANFYAVNSKFGQLMFFASQILANLFFARIAQEKNSTKTLSYLIIGNIFFTILGVLFFALLSEYIIRYSFGEEYLLGHEFLWVSALIGGGVSILNQLTMFFISRGRYGFLWILGIMLLFFVFWGGFLGFYDFNQFLIVFGASLSVSIVGAGMLVLKK